MTKIGKRDRYLQILLGHESLDTTTRYVHASDKYAEETHRKYHPLAKPERNTIAVTLCQLLKRTLLRSRWWVANTILGGTRNSASGLERQISGSASNY
jgi:hypothetical protein